MALWPEDGHVSVVKLSLQGANQKRQKSKDLGQIWDFAEEAKKAQMGDKTHHFLKKVKPHKYPKP
jgi:hypothetical protein|tara:strand:- start:580 stop:774 length:195 start_codon:yes stop_codon:yes gene_type:complete